MTVEVKTTVRFRSLEVPDSVRLMVEIEETPDDPSIPLAELEPEVIDALAETWLANLYASLNRQSPFTRREYARAA